MTKLAIKADEKTATKQAVSRSRHSWDVPKQRACLCCRTLFDSQWSGERICGVCKGRKSWRGSALG